MGIARTMAKPSTQRCVLSDTEGENYGLKVTLRKKSVIGGPAAMTAQIEALDLPQNGAKLSVRRKETDAGLISTPLLEHVNDVRGSLTIDA